MEPHTRCYQSIVAMHGGKIDLGTPSAKYLQMTTTVGDLISGLLDVYERRYHDHELAAVKTALVVDELLRARERRDAAEALSVAHGRTRVVAAHGATGLAR
jgi:hypothetical protein